MDWLVDKRNQLFIGMCLLVHIFLLILFAYLSIWKMVILNTTSVCFYLWVILFDKSYSENLIVFSYFEIIFFATISTSIVGRQAGFVLYIVGMISVVFYLAYHHGNRRFIYQGVGVVSVLSIVMMEPFVNQICIEEKMAVASISRGLYTMNLVITLCTVVIISYLYAQEINRMNKEIRQAHKELDYQASHDELTGLLNRHEMNKYIDRINQMNSTKLIVAMMDVDDFKKINDQYGHAAGDLVLVKIAEVLEKYLEGYCIARWGGEEFLCICECCEGDGSLNKMYDFHKAIQKEYIEYEGIKININVTVGLINENVDYNIDHLVVEADKLLYIGKNNQKNCIITSEIKNPL